MPPLQAPTPASLPARSRTFHRFASATFQINRASALEPFPQDRWADEPGHHPAWFSQTERFIKLGAIQEQLTDKALIELRKLQRECRLRCLRDTGPVLAIEALVTTEKAKLIAKAKPNPVENATAYFNLIQENRIRSGVEVGHLKP